MQNAIRIFNFDLREKVVGVWDENIPIVRHAVIECAGVESKLLQEDVFIKNLEEIANELNLHIVNKIVHTFSPQGQSIVFILEESHLAVHTWPERGYVHVDMVTCSLDEMVLIKIADVFNNSFKPVSTRVIRFKY